MASAFIGVQFGVLVALLFGPGSRQDRRWPVVFSCGLGVHFCTCLEFFPTQRFVALLVYHVLKGFKSFLLFPRGSVSLLSFGIGIGVTLKSFFHLVLKGLGTTFLFGISNDLLWVG